MQTIRSLAADAFAEYDRFLKSDHPRVRPPVSTDEANLAAVYQQFQTSATANQVDLQLITVKANTGADSEFTVRAANEGSITDHLDKINGAACANLALVVIPHDTQSWSFNISKTAFLSIFESCKIEPTVLDLVRNPTWGNFRFRQAGGCVTHYVGTVFYGICWSFDPATMTTRAIMIPRSTFDAGLAKDILSCFVKRLKTQKNHIYTPHTLTFVLMVDLIYNIERLKSRDLTRLAQVELVTGHGLWTRTLSGWQETATSQLLHQLKGASRIVGNMVVCYSRYIRHLHITEILVRDMRDDVAWNDSVYARDDLKSQRMQHEADIMHREEAVQYLERRIEMLRPTLAYEMERLKTQASVITSLISHEDARTSNKVAEASKELGEAARRDGTAMKTIAVMTMLFLPSTFLATLFAVPSLRWDEPNVVQSNFWVFWAMAIPLTVLVFVTWHLLTYYTMPSWLDGKSDKQCGNNSM